LFIRIVLFPYEARVVRDAVGTVAVVTAVAVPETVRVALPVPDETDFTDVA